MSAPPNQAAPSPRKPRLALIGLAAVALACWAYLVFAARMPMAPSSPVTAPMDGAMPGMAGMTPAIAIHVADYAALALMWTTMMGAMMLPSATPMVSLFGAVGGQVRARGEPAAPTWLFVLGYLAVWIGFGLVATTLQALLDHAARLDTRAALINRNAAGALLIAAGLYQLTPWKQTCLRHCRSPMSFVITHWRAGRAGALRMGLVHGLFCLGCCWCLMLLLFVGGVMNLWWILALTGFVIVEKTLPGRIWIERCSAALLVGWGALTLAGIVG